jgi:hypothetical protein
MSEFKKNLFFNKNEGLNNKLKVKLDKSDISYEVREMN